MMHDSLADQSRVKVSSDRSFGFVFTAVFLLFGSYSYLNSEGSLGYTLFGLAGVIAVISFVMPKLLHPLNILWFKFGRLLHRVVSPLVMGAVYFLILCPIALLAKKTGRDFLSLRYDQEAKSYWIERDPPGPSPDSLKNQF